MKIVVFDLETIWDADEWLREDRAFSIGNWPGRTMKADINSIITFGYQILGEEPKSVSVWDFVDYDYTKLNDDFMVCAFAESILSDADAIITHNGKRFDFKFLQTRLKKHKLPLLDPKTPHIDTCAEAKKAYSLYSNRLKDLTQFLGVSAKISTGGRNLWTRIYRGDKEAEKEMAIYCEQDVKATGECALAMQAEIKSWPNYNVIFGTKENCPNAVCGSLNTQKHGVRRTKTKEKQRYRCLDCGTAFEKPKKKVARV